MESFKDICDRVGQLARTVGRDLTEKRNAGFGIEAKGHNDFVTDLDRYSERCLVAGLESILPQAGFIAEEGTRSQQAERLNWIVDPIDGTTNFIHNSAPFAISIGLQCDGQMVVGVVYEMGRDELFAATLGGGATLNGRPIATSAARRVDDALVATGFPYSNFDRLGQYNRALDTFVRRSHGVRRYGSAATDLAYVACGRFDCFFEYDLKPYDVAAGSLLVTEAGGRVSDFGGGTNYLFGREMVASAPALYPEFLQIISQSFGAQ